MLVCNDKRKLNRMIETIYLCPSTPIDECRWEGRQEEILQHFETCHRSFFLSMNYFNMELNRDCSVNYLMHLNGETYLVQFKYSQLEDVAEIRLRLLGTLKKAHTLSYYIEIDSGNFAFTTKNHSDGYSLITRKEGAILIDVSGIRTVCGRKILENIVCYVNIEGETNSYVYRSIRRSATDSKVTDNKVRDIFQRNSSFRSSIRKKSIDGFDFVADYRRQSLISDEPPQNELLFINEIIQEIVNHAVEESESKYNSNSEINEYFTSMHFTDPFIPSFFDDDDAFGFHTKHDFDFDSKFFAGFHTFQEFGNRNQTSFYCESSSGVMKTTEFCVKTELESIQEHECEHAIKINRKDDHKIEEIDEQPETTHQEENKVTEEIEQTCCESEVPDTKQEKEDDLLDIDDDVILRPKSSKLAPNRLSRAETEYYEKIQLMRCENCSMIMIPPIFVCLNGHSVCINCKPLNCSCKSEVTDMRNIDLEEISRSLTHPCRFLEKGCTKLYSCYEIRFHEIKCEYFQYKCPHCSYVGKYNEVIAHIKLLHPSLKLVETMENPFPRNSDYLIANRFGMFYCTAFIYDNSIEWCVAFAGREKISFSCTVAIKSKKNTKIYQLRKNGNTCKSIIHLNELKNSRVKDKNAVLNIRTY